MSVSEGFLLSRSPPVSCLKILVVPIFVVWMVSAMLAAGRPGTQRIFRSWVGRILSAIVGKGCGEPWRQLDPGTRPLWTGEFAAPAQPNPSMWVAIRSQAVTFGTTESLSDKVCPHLARSLSRVTWRLSIWRSSNFQWSVTQAAKQSFLRAPLPFHRINDHHCPAQRTFLHHKAVLNTIIIDIHQQSSTIPLSFSCTATRPNLGIGIWSQWSTDIPSVWFETSLALLHQAEINDVPHLNLTRPEARSRRLTYGVGAVQWHPKQNTTVLCTSLMDAM